MYKEQKILAIITARGGSKGLPGKNIKKLHGKPLIAWTIEHVKNSKLIDYLFISTDSKEIAEICEIYGQCVTELRPAYLATDSSSSMDVIVYTLERLKSYGQEYEYVMLLEPTSPMRKKGDLDNMIKLAVDNSDKDGVISVGKVHLEHPMIVKKISEEGNIVPYMMGQAVAYQRQQHDEALFPYGVGYLIKTVVFNAEHTIYTSNMLPYYIERWQSYEIDDIYDFKCIETILQMEKGNLELNDEYVKD